MGHVKAFQILSHNPLLITPNPLLIVSSCLSLLLLGHQTSDPQCFFRFWTSYQITNKGAKPSPLTHQSIFGGYDWLTILILVESKTFGKQLTYERDQPVSPRVLSLVVKTSHRYWKILTPPKLGSKKTGLIIAFTIALTLDVKIVWFGRQVAVCVQKRHQNAIFGCSWFQKFNFDCLLLKLLIYSQTTENIFKFVCPLLIQSSIMISGN